MEWMKADLMALQWAERKVETRDDRTAVTRAHQRVEKRAGQKVYHLADRRAEHWV